MARLPLNERDDKKWERDNDRGRMMSAKERAIALYSDVLMAAKLGMDFKSEDGDGQVILDRLWDELRDHTTRQDLIALLIESVYDDANRAATDKFNRYKQDSARASVQTIAGS